MINTYITELVNYGISKGLIEEYDRIYALNRLTELMELDEYIEPSVTPEPRDLHLILEDMMAWAFEHGVMKSDTTAYKDLFDTKIMGAITPPPSVVIKKFRQQTGIMLSRKLQTISAQTESQRMLSGSLPQSSATSISPST